MSHQYAAAHGGLLLICPLNNHKALSYENKTKTPEKKQPK